jgi:hypothetical protein
MSEFTVAGPPDFEVTCNGLTRALDYFTERGCCRLFVLSDPFLVSNTLSGTLAVNLAAQIEAINQGRFQISIHSAFGVSGLGVMRDAQILPYKFNVVQTLLCGWFRIILRHIQRTLKTSRAAITARWAR